MGEIRQTSHHYCSLDKVDKFFNDVNESINKMQEQGMTVEVQYQQSNGFFSAFIIGK